MRHPNLPRWLRPRPPRPRSIRKRLRRIFSSIAVFSAVLTTILVITAFNLSAGQFAPEQGVDPAEARRWHEATVAFRGSFLRSVIIAAVITSALASVAAAELARQLARPITRMADAVRRVADGERDVRLPVPQRTDELRELTLNFNHLVAELARQEAWRRGLVADISHDLRTPLAVLQSDIESMQDGLNPRDDAALARLHDEVTLLTRLVRDLRTLSLAESGAMPLNIEAVSLAPFLEGVTGALAGPAREAGASIVLDAPEDLTVLADRTRLTQVLNNVLENALRYAAPGTVEVSLHAEDGNAVVTVRDHGPGFRPQDLQRAFERFYRADASRTRDPHGQRSSGLGLAIARALVEAQGGRIEARNHEGGGAEVTLRLPVPAS
ncbi:MAG TPA: ATP-binding protein [Deinococcales bacterium]|nr:ATP-binding protein [Deinococcales bacterium]